MTISRKKYKYIFNIRVSRIICQAKILDILESSLKIRDDSISRLQSTIYSYTHIL